MRCPPWPTSPGSSFSSAPPRSTGSTASPRTSAARSRSGRSARTATPGLAYGGNKVRKLEYLVADAIAQGCDTLVSIGGVQSNHTRQVAAVAAHLGLGCVLVQEHWVGWDDPVYDRVGNILLSRIMGADVRMSDAGFDIGFRDSWEDALAEVAGRGGKPYPIPAGASDHPLGGHGFARLGGRGGGAGGRARPLLRHGRRLLGHRFDPGRDDRRLRRPGARARRARNRRLRHRAADLDQIARIARRTAEAIGLGRPLADDEIVLLDEWHAGTYGIPDAKTIDAIRLCARLEGILTDPVYEGKSMAALIDLVQDGRIAPGSKVLYAHLGGQPALNAYVGAFS